MKHKQNTNKYKQDCKFEQRCYLSYLLFPFLVLFFSSLVFFFSSSLFPFLFFPLLFFICLAPSPEFAILPSACLGNPRNLLELLVLVSGIREICWNYQCLSQIERILEILIIKVKFNLRGPIPFWTSQNASYIRHMPKEGGGVPDH